MPQIHQNGVQFNSQLAKVKVIPTIKVIKIPLKNICIHI